MEKTGKLVIFDLDGTLNKTELFSVGAHRMVQTEFGWPAQSQKQIMSIFGAPACEYIDKLLPGASAETQQKYLKRVSQVECDCMNLAAAYDGCSEMMDELHKNGCKTAVCSNSSSRYINAALNAIKLADKIDYIQQLEPGMTEKGQSLRVLLEKTGCQNAVMVGDTAYDWNAAQDNEIPFIGCRYGYRPQEIENAEYVADRPMEVPVIVNSLFD